MRNPYKGSYDELCAKVNETYKRTNDIHETVKETVIGFVIIWEMLGFKDYFKFYETEGGQMERPLGTLILGVCICMLIRFNRLQLEC